MTKIEDFAKIIKESKRIVFFGGAGVSTESGIKDYRSKDGLYNTVKQYGVSPEEILSKHFFEEKPEIFYDFYRSYFITSAEPNAAHYALARLEREGKLSAVITQNIDGLHQSAGSRNVIELHGTTSVFFCHSCKASAEPFETNKTIASGGIPRCPKCGGVIRPKVVMYEEPLYPGTIERAVEAISGADTLIIGGTSLAVYPANSFIRFFGGDNLVIINKTETKFDSAANLIMRSKIGETFERVMELI